MQTWSSRCSSASRPSGAERAGGRAAEHGARQHARLSSPPTPLPPPPHPRAPPPPPPRDFFLRPENYAACDSLLVRRFGELVRKVWNQRAFKGQVSPHEFMQVRA